MPFETISNGLTLVIPTEGTTNWAANLKANAWEKISSHDHSGSGMGTPISAAGLAANSITKAKLDTAIGPYQASQSLSGASPTATLDLSAAPSHLVDFDTASGTVTFVLNNPLEGMLYRIVITYGANTVAITYPGTILFPQGQEPILPTTDNAVHKIDLYYNGTNFIADWNREYA